MSVKNKLVKLQPTSSFFLMQKMYRKKHLSPEIPSASAAILIPQLYIGALF